jgi:hypothetical protein
MKLKRSRSADSSANVACFRCSGVSDSRKRLAASAMAFRPRCADTDAPSAIAPSTATATIARRDTKRIIDTSLARGW